MGWVDKAVGLELGDGVGQLPAGQAHLHGAEVLEVAADGGLGGGDPGAGEEVDELGLAGDLVLGEQPPDPVLPLRLRGHVRLGSVVGTVLECRRSAAAVPSEHRLSERSESAPRRRRNNSAFLIGVCP